jgi:hypothetical protein
MRNCREISELVSESMDRPQRNIDRMETWLHLKFCPGCRRFAQQLEIIRLGIARLWEESAAELADTSDAYLSDVAKDRILERLRRD